MSRSYYRSLIATVAPLLLDLYPAAAAWSLRKLRNDYNGAPIRVRRSNDDAEQDIGFDGNGNLDEAALLAFVGSNSAFVSRYYDHTGGGRDFVQTTQSSQPRIVNAGVVEQRNGRPSMFFDGVDDFMDVLSSTGSFNYLHQSGQSYVSIVVQAGTSANPDTAYSLLDNTALASANVGYGIFYDDRSSISRNDIIASFVTRGGVFVSQNFTNNNVFPANQLSLLSNIINNNSGTAQNRNLLYRNSNALFPTNSSTAPVSTANASFNMRIGRRANNTDFNLNGYISEVILWSTDQASVRTAIESNTRSHFSIP